MRRVRTLAGVLGVCLIGMVATSTRAAVTFDFISDQSNYTVLPNGTATVQVFLRETLSGTSTSLVLAEDGLFSAEALLTRTTSPSAPFSITAASRNATNFDAINDSSVVAGGAQANVGGARSLGSTHGTAVITDSATVRRVSIGSFTIQGGLIPLQTTTFTLSDRPATNDTLTWTNGTVLDPQILSRTFTATILPEPTTLGVLGLGMLSLLARRRRTASRQTN